MVFARAFDEYVRQTGMHGAAPIPCVSRSLTEEEARAVTRGQIVWSVQVLVFFFLLFGGIAWFSEAPPEKLMFMGYALAGMIPLVALVTWLKIRKRRGYRDPHFRVEIGEDEVVVVGPAGRDARAYAALAPIELLSEATKSSRRFVGITLDSRLGPVRLDDDWYDRGQSAAGAILKRMDALGLPLSPQP
jgi:hypothetical protein